MAEDVLYKLLAFRPFPLKINHQCYEVVDFYHLFIDSETFFVFLFSTTFFVTSIKLLKITFCSRLFLINFIN